MMAKIMLVMMLLVSVGLFSNLDAANDSTCSQIPQLKVLIAHSQQGYSSSIKQLLESKGIKVDNMAVGSLSDSIVKPYDLIIVTGSGRRNKSFGNLKEYDKPVLGYGVYGCAYFGHLKLKNGWPYT
ncbi:MAG: hypothetical protein JEZ07_19965 [Phycisphaerae bacterium]|nr:hypothetical protein [Phycisphaerae bacterium]